jgi:hypothetical protein
MESSRNKLPVRPFGLPDCYGMIATTICWLLLSAALAIASLQQLPLSSAVNAFLSILCGPFAFFEHEPLALHWDVTLIWSLLCLTPIAVHLFVRQTMTAIFAGFGISLWFFLGMGITFIGV